MTFGVSARNCVRTLALVWRTNRTLAITIIALIVAAALLPAVAIYVAKLIVDGVIAAAASGDAADRTRVLLWVGAEGAVLTLLFACRHYLLLRKRLFNVEIGYAVGRLIYAKSLEMELKQLEDPAVQERLVLARQHAMRRPHELFARFCDIAEHGLALCAFVPLLWLFSPWAVAIVAVGAVPLFLADLRFLKRVFRLYTGRTPETRERLYLEKLMTSDELAAERLHVDAGPQVMARFKALFDRLHGEDRRLQTRRTHAGVAMNAVGSAAVLGGKAWVVWETIAGAITLGQMTMFIAALKQSQSRLAALLGALGGGYEGLLYIANLYELLAIPTPVRGGTAEQGVRPGDGLRLEAVSFNYPGAIRPALHDITLHIPPGSRVGIVGANGSGKSTLVKLLRGLYRPDSGHATLDGTDLGDWAPAALRRRFAVMFQPFVRYKMTVGENIAMGDGLRIDDAAALNEAAERAAAGALIDELPDGLATRLTRRFRDGRELSTGQWQRLALARTMLNVDADIVILDEPTSALDPASEAEFLDAAIGAAASSRTTIFITHRIANLRRADHIVVFDHGRIAEQGNHSELMRNVGPYHRLLTHQAHLYAVVSACPDAPAESDTLPEAIGQAGASAVR